MAYLNLSFSLDIANVLDDEIVNGKLLPLVSEAVDKVGQTLAKNWIDAVQEAKLSSYEKDAYRTSISWNFAKGSLKGEAEATYKFASEIETGRPARDLKRMLSTSQKVRRTKTGKRFLVIPMKQSTEKLKAMNMYSAASSLEKSIVTGMRQRRSGEVTELSKRSGMRPAAKQTGYLYNTDTKKHTTVNQSVYKWGGSLQGNNVPKNLKGLVRFDTSTPNQNYSSFLTFRIMMEGQTGWVIPAQPGQYIAKKVVDDLQPIAEQAISGAVKYTF